MALCDGETVLAVELSAYTERDDGSVVRNPTLWKIEAGTPSKSTRFVVGETPAGFVVSVPLSDLPDGDLTLNVTTEGGYSGFHGEVFDPRRLQDGILVNGEVTSLQRLRRDAEANCSFLGLALPRWVGWAGAALAVILIAGVVGFGIARTRKEPELPTRF